MANAEKDVTKMQRRGNESVMVFQQGVRWKKKGFN